MARFVGHRAGQVVWVADAPLGPDYIETDLDIPASELISNYAVRRNVLVPRTNYRQRVALVSVYGVPCGISTYSEWLWQEMSRRANECHIFAERENDLPDGPGLTRCWGRGQPLTELVQQLKEYDPDIVYVQHEYGLFPIARHWLSFISELSGRRVITTLHSVYEEHRDKTIVEAACPEIVVHSEGARRVLREKGVATPIHVIPHGCQPAEPGQLWNLYGSEHTILQFGFGFPYKGWENSLRVVAALKPIYPDVFFTGLISERFHDAHVAYVADLLALARELGISENVALLRGFQSDDALDSYMRTNRVGLFPYKENGSHTVMGCSGAARLAMSKDLPVVVSGVPLFEDLEGVAERPVTVEGWTDAIRRAFENPDAQRIKQRAFLEANSWANVADAYLSL